MKRYEMTAEYNSVGCYDEVIPVESADGDWIKFSDYQAATEAAKATGTAGDLPEPKLKWRHADICGDEIAPFDPLYSADQMREYGQACAEAAWNNCATLNQERIRQLTYAEAARQPAPAVNPEVLKEQASVALIQRKKIQDLQKTVLDLRAALAATAEPIAAYGLPPFPANGYGTLSSDGIFHAGYIAAISNLPNGLIECMREAAQVLSGQKENRVPLADELDGFASILAATRSQP